MAVPNPLPPAGHPILVYDASVTEYPGNVVVPWSMVGGANVSLIAYDSPSGRVFEYWDYDESATPQPSTWRYDPLYPPDATPGTLDARVDAIDTEQDAQDASIATNSSDVSALQASVTSLDARLAAAEAAIASMQGTITTLQNDLAAAEAAISTLQSGQDTNGAAIAGLSSDSSLHTTALAQIRSRYPAHFHGLLGLGGDPVGSTGDLSYSLPGDP